MDSNSVLKIFREITKIPRESGHEEKMAEFLKNFAEEHHLAYKKDEAGNVCITREASKGKENVPTLVLQGHQDMVCEKVSGSDFDFSKDPIKYEIEDGWMVARETTLGADDGIGVAATLAVLEDESLQTGKIEGIFTTSEETSMVGANGMKEGFFTGKTLVNLDSEDEGQMFVGCAGGIDTVATFNYEREDLLPGVATLTLKIWNTLGGHSGDDINKDRINTIQQLCRFLFEEKVPYQLIEISGGGKHNAIPRDCQAIIAVPSDKAADVRAEFEAFGKTLAEEYHKSDPMVKVSAQAIRCNEKPIAKATADKLIMSMLAAYHGVLGMSQDIEGLVETSNNLASVHMKNDGEIEVYTSQRSSVDSERDYISDKIKAVFLLAGAKVENHDAYPGWAPDLNSKILKVAVESYHKLFGHDPEVKAIHAGLECGLFLQKFPGLDMVSFGPTLRNVHTPGEKLDLESLDKFTAHLADVVTSFK